jgi:predicted component of type VI protein secretion system
MPFEKGNSGNPEGRPKGTNNKLSKQLRETINDFLETNFETVINDFEKLTPKERLKFYCELLQYGLPKLQAVQMETEFENLSDEQLNFIIQELLKTNEHGQ